MGMPTFRRGGDQSLPGMPERPAKQADQQPRARAAAPGVRPNRYGGRCQICGGYVEAGDGILVGSAKTGWGVEHAECPPAHPQPGDEDMKEPWVPEVPAEHVINQVKGQPLYDGIYTYETMTAYRTFRLRTQGLDDDFMPGKQIIEVLSGPDNERDYQSFGHLIPLGERGVRLQVWKRHQGKETLIKDARAFLDDPHGEAVTPSINCFRCGRTLTVPASVHNGLGPECAKKGM